MFPHRPTQPTIVILDMTWLHYFEQTALPVFTVLPIYSAIEIITRHPPYEDCNDRLWDAFYHTQDLYSEPDDRLVLMAEITLELLIQEFYDRMEHDLPDYSGDYVFYRWMGQRALAMIRTDHALHLPRE